MARLVPINLSRFGYATIKAHKNGLSRAQSLERILRPDIDIMPGNSRRAGPAHHQFHLCELGHSELTGELVQPAQQCGRDRNSIAASRHARLMATLAR
jgi:hypothetical protein